MTHLCHALGCEKPVPPRLLMCPKHWHMVPKKLQQQVWWRYRVGQEVDKNPSRSYLKAALAAIRAVAKLEGVKTKVTRRGFGL